MKKYLRLYLLLIRLNFSSLTAYRSNFLTSTFSSLTWAVFQIITILILTTNVQTAFGWNRVEMIILVSSFNIFIGIFHMVFSPNFERFSEIINLGQLDTLLLKPVNSQFLVSLWLVNIASIFRVLFGFLFVTYFIISSNIGVSFLSIIGYLLIIPFSLVLLYSIWFIVMTLIIWFTRLTNLVDLMYTLNGFSRYPKEMFKSASPLVFYFVFPLVIIVTTPTKVLLQKFSLSEVIILLAITAVFFYFSKMFWKFALRFYTSAGG